MATDATSAAIATLEKLLIEYNLGHILPALREYGAMGVDDLPYRIGDLDLLQSLRLDGL